MLISEAVLAAGVLPQIKTHISSIEPCNVIDDPASLHGGVRVRHVARAVRILASYAQ